MTDIFSFYLFPYPFYLFPTTVAKSNDQGMFSDRTVKRDWEINKNFKVNSFPVISLLSTQTRSPVPRQEK